MQSDMMLPWPADEASAPEGVGPLALKPGLRRNLDGKALYQIALGLGEARLSRDGALTVDTGQHTGRSPRDKFIVREPATEPAIDWTNNSAMARDSFERLQADVLAHLDGSRELFLQELSAGADPAHGIDVDVYTEFAWHSLFIRNLLLPRSATGGTRRKLTVIAAPRFRPDAARYGIRSETVIACDLAGGTIIIAGTSYAGEMKKAVFTYLNYLLPEQGVTPMHCSANVGAEGDVAIFFGLSGTGKTTLSATASRTLIGDDEHGWSTAGVFNFEGGCYAKVIGLSLADEPQIHTATNRFGTVLENVTLSDATGEPDFHDASRTENTRSAYPLSFIPNASATGRAGHPRNIVMLTADAFGVLPPIARLTPDQAVYHFLSGFTAKVAGTEKGVREPQPTFSACFGAPFMPRRPVEYGDLLRSMITRHSVDCWLLNTGWTGGPVGVGRRMPLYWTRTLLEAALDGSVARGGFRRDARFGFEVPVAVPGVPDHVLRPHETWPDEPAFSRQASELVRMFTANFARFEKSVSASVLAAGPRQEAHA